MLHFVTDTPTEFFLRTLPGVLPSFVPVLRKGTAGPLDTYVMMESDVTFSYIQELSGKKIRPVMLLRPGLES